jgi:hypothetical protein
MKRAEADDNRQINGLQAHVARRNAGLNLPAAAAAAAAAGTLFVHMSLTTCATSDYFIPVHGRDRIATVNRFKRSEFNPRHA